MDIKELCNKLKPIHGKKIDKLYLAYLMSQNIQEKKEIEHILQFYLAKAEGYKTLPQLLLCPPEGEAHGGQYYLGNVLYNGRVLYPFSLHSSEMVQHMAVFGRSGSGKTNFIKSLLRSFIKQKKPFLLFDWKKDYSRIDFKSTFGGIGDSKNDILVLPAGKRNIGFRFNPLIPPKDVDPTIWVKKICEILTHSYLGGPGFESIFLKAIDHVYTEFGIYSGNITRYPTMNDIKEFLEDNKFSGREAQWLQSVMRTIRTMCYGGMGDMINVLKQIPIEELLEKQVILELDTLSNADKTFVIESLLLWIQHYRLQQGSFNSSFKHAIIVEEAHHILRQKFENEESIVDLILREVRSLGESVILIDQIPSLISKVALANTYCTVAFNLKTNDDINTLSRCMLLERDEKKFLGMLPVGECIVRIQDRCPNPFQLKIPLIKTIETESPFYYHYPEVTERVPPVCSNSEPKTKDYSDIHGFAGQLNTTGNNKNSDKLEDPNNLDNQKDPEDPEDLLLIDIHKHPIDPVTSRYSRMGITPRKGNYLKSKLLKNEYIKSITFGGLGAWIRLFEITVRGLKKLNQFGIKIDSDRYGSLEHKYWCYKVSSYFEEKGYKVEPEKPLGEGKTIDIVISKKDKKVLVSIAIEVETGKSDYISNIQKCIKHGFEKIICAVTRKIFFEKIKSEIGNIFKESSDKVNVVYVRDLLKQD